MSNSFQIPDLTKICGDQFELRVNQHCHAVGKETLRWLDELDFFADEESRAQFLTTQLPLLAALCYPTCDLTQLRTATDFLAILIYGCHRSRSVNEGTRQTGLEEYVIS